MSIIKVRSSTIGIAANEKNRNHCIYKFNLKDFLPFETC